MIRRRLSEDCWVSPIGLGTVKFGRSTDVRYPQPFQIPSFSELKDLLDVAMAHDINLIDTAPAYGTSEAVIGRLLKGQRQRWVLSSKAGETYKDGQSTFDFSSAGIERSVMQSLERLQTDFINLIFIHSNGDDEDIILRSAAIPTLQRMKEKGVIGLIGASMKTTAGGLLALDHVDVVMASYNMNYQDELPVLLKARDMGKAVFIKKALDSGHLSGSESSALEFVLKNTAVTSAIVGTINPDHLRQNVQAATTAFESSQPGR